MIPVLDPLLLAAGAALALWGRQLFWLATALLVFVVVWAAAGQILAGQPAWLIQGIGIAAGLTAGVAAVLLQGLALALAAFLAGAIAMQELLVLFGQAQADWAWVAWLGGGALGLLLAMAVFDWALAILTAVLGGVLVAEGIVAGMPWRLAAFAVVVAAGLGFQTRGLRRRRADQGGSRVQ